MLTNMFLDPDFTKLIAEERRRSLLSDGRRVRLARWLRRRRSEAPLEPTGPDGEAPGRAPVNPLPDGTPVPDDRPEDEPAALAA